MVVTAAYSLLKDAVQSNGPRIQSMGQSWTHSARMSWENYTNSSVPSIRDSYSDALEGDIPTLYLYILKDPWVYTPRVPRWDEAPEAHNSNGTCCLLFPLSPSHFPTHASWNHFTNKLRVPNSCLRACFCETIN